MVGSYLLEGRIKGVILRTEILPVLRSDLGLRAADVILGSFAKYNSETSFQMPVNVAIRKSGSNRVLGLNVITINTHNKLTNPLMRRSVSIVCTLSSSGLNLVTNLYF